MPLFSSRFSFKKAEIRRKKVPDNISFDAESDQAEDYDDDSDNSEHSSDGDNPRKLDKRQRKRPNLAKSKSSLSLKDNKENFRKQNRRLVLTLNSQQNVLFDFNKRKGNWVEQKDGTGSGELTSGLVVRPFSRSASLPGSKSSVDPVGQISELIKKTAELTERNQTLEEENRLMKLKIEILMEMITETTAELNLKDKPPKE